MSSPKQGDRGPSRRELEEVRDTTRMLRREVGELKGLLRTADNGNSYLTALLDKPVGFIAGDTVSNGILRWFDRFHLGIQPTRIGDTAYTGDRVAMYSKASVHCIWGAEDGDGE